jgi:serine/threonine protein kinase
VSPLSDDEPRPGEPESSSSSLGEPDQGTHRRRKRAPRDDSLALGQFELLELLGTGDMGQVYRAIDTDTECVLAVKVLRQLSSSRRRALERRFDELSQHSHPHLVQLYELFIADGGAHFSQELVSGTNLDDYLFGADSGQRDFGEGAVARLIEATRQICAALEFLHSRRLVHHNLKPSNLLVADGGRVVLLDGGLLPEHELWDLQPFDRLLHSGISYAAPEMFVRGAGAGAAADLFALGAILHEFVTGTRAELLDDPSQRVTPSPDQLPRHLPQSLRDLIASLLLVEPSRRPSADKALATLSRLGRPARNALPTIRQTDYARLEWQPPAETRIQVVPERECQM